MAKTRLSVAKYVTRGYGQVEPNHLSAQRTGQIYAQLPANADIEVLENGQFVKYDYANGEVNTTAETGEWMLVLNEVKLYRDGLTYNDFAMKKEDYAAFVYSPVDGVNPTYAHSRDYSKVVTPADPYEVDSTANPFEVERFKAPKLMKEGTNMVPRVFKTNIGDIFTTNCVNEAAGSLAVGEELVIGEGGYLSKTGAANAGDMKWQIVKVYTLADRQPAVKVMRIA